MKNEDPADAQVPLMTGPERPNKFTVTLEARPHGGAVVLHCQGRLIFQPQAHALSETVSTVLPRVERMVLDLAGIESVDSAGLGELVLLHMWAQAGGYMLKFASPNKSVRQLLERTNLAAVFDIYATVPEAIGAMHAEELRLA